MADTEKCKKCSHKTDAHICRFCLDFNKYYPMTNGMKIRSMSDEELADFLAEYEICTNCQYLEIDCNFEGVCTKGFASAMALEWLKSEVKE